MQAAGPAGARALGRAQAPCACRPGCRVGPSTSEAGLSLGCEGRGQTTQGFEGHSDAQVWILV